MSKQNSNGVAGLSLKNPAYPASLKAEVALKVISKELSLHQAFATIPDNSKLILHSD